MFYYSLFNLFFFTSELRKYDANQMVHQAFDSSSDQRQVCKARLILLENEI